jgi:hypothetical protein
MPRPLRHDIQPIPVTNRGPAADIQGKLAGDNVVDRREVDDLVRVWTSTPIDQAKADAIRGAVAGQLDKFDRSARVAMGVFIDGRLPQLTIQHIDPTGADATHIAKLSWTPPTMNTDGTPLTTLAGYKVLYGNAPGNYTHELSITDPSATSFTVTGLAPGTWYFAMKAVDTAGNESAPSGEAWKTIR